MEAIHRLLDAKPKPTALTAVLADLSVHEDPLPQCAATAAIWDVCTRPSHVLERFQVDQ